MSDTTGPTGLSIDTITPLASTTLYRMPGLSET